MEGVGGNGGRGDDGGRGRGNDGGRGREGDGVVGGREGEHWSSLTWACRRIHPLSSVGGCCVRGGSSFVWDRVIRGWGVICVRLRDVLVVALVARCGFSVMVWVWWWAFPWVGGRRCPWVLVVQGSVVGASLWWAGCRCPCTLVGGVGGGARRLSWFRCDGLGVVVGVRMGGGSSLPVGACRSWVRGWGILVVGRVSLSVVGRCPWWVVVRGGSLSVCACERCWWWRSSPVVVERGVSAWWW